MQRKKYQTIGGQLLIWITIWFTVSFVLTNGIDHPSRYVQITTPKIIGIIIIVYVNLKYLLPQLYFKKKISLYIVVSFLLMAMILFLSFYTGMPWADWIAPPRMINGVLHSRTHVPFGGWMARVMPLLMAYLGSTLMEISRYASQKEKEAIHSESSKLATEIKFLKSQINPHFLFNVLNNIYALTVIKSEKAPENLMRLSGMLRYMLYDSNEDKVPLAKEISYLKNYINLVGLKDSRGLNIELHLEENYPNLQIAPLLFIPFVENAFKHSKIEDLKKGYIKICLKVIAQQLVFKVENSVPLNSYTKDKIGGIGLFNIQQRLKLIYPNQHELKIETRKDQFYVSLKIDLL